MFKFNFHADKAFEACDAEVKKSELSWIKSSVNVVTREHIIKAKELLCHNLDLDSFIWGQNVLKFVSTDGLKKNLDEEQSNFSSNLSHSDLVPALYEGGLKIWECTWDLLNYISESKIDFQNKRVLELGCGAGLPGLAASLKGASVSFQDYNAEVLNWFTIPNVLLNYNIICPTKSEEFPAEDDMFLSSVNSKFNFYSGDWEGFSSLALSRGGEFDIILTSETIYNRENHPKLLDIFATCLKNDGIVILAAKSHYFGVGGGTYDFTKLVESGNSFNISSTVCHNKGVKREILTLQKKLNN